MPAATAPADNMHRFTVAIDGPAAAGKGTIGRALALRFGFEHMDTGLLYRAVSSILREEAWTGDTEHATRVASHLVAADLARPGLRCRQTSIDSSIVAAIPGVRAELLGLQRRFARRDGGAVLDGRDIGTVVVPDAEVKLFVTATVGERARRRQRELAAAGTGVSLEEVMHDLNVRDDRDRKRGLAGLKLADDALLLDTSKLSIEQAVDKAASAVEKRFDAVR